MGSVCPSEATLEMASSRGKAVVRKRGVMLETSNRYCCHRLACRMVGADVEEVGRAVVVVTSSIRTDAASSLSDSA